MLGPENKIVYKDVLLFLGIRFNMARTINIFVINAKHLTQRLEQVLKLVQFIGGTAKTIGFERINCSTIRVSDRSDVVAKMGDYAKRISYEKTGDIYDNNLETLSAELISNIENHRGAWQTIAGINDPNAINMVLEDDTVVLQDHNGNLKDLLSYLYNYEASQSESWDMLFTGIAPPQETNTFEIVSASTVDVLMSKEAYFINQETARKLAAEWSDNKLTHALRIQLSKYLKTKRDEIKVMYTNRRVTLDSSKLGLVPTTIHTNNILVFNGKFMPLLSTYLELNKCDDDIEKRTELFQQAKALYKDVVNTKFVGFADTTHIYGLILFKMKMYADAEDMFLTAIKATTEQQGLVSSNTDLLNNALNVYQFVQKDIDDIFKHQSKYAIPGVIPLLDS